MFHFKIPWHCLLHFISDNLEQLSNIYYLDVFLGHFLYVRIIQTSCQEVLQSVSLRMLIQRENTVFLSCEERTGSVSFAAYFSVFPGSLLALVFSPGKATDLSLVAGCRGSSPDQNRRSRGRIELQSVSIPSLTIYFHRGMSWTPHA